MLMAEIAHLGAILTYQDIPVNRIEKAGKTGARPDFPGFFGLPAAVRGRLSPEAGFGASPFSAVSCLAFRPIQEKIRKIKKYSVKALDKQCVA
jgi:hypothetical protein